MAAAASIAVRQSSRVEADLMVCTDAEELSINWSTKTEEEEATGCPLDAETDLHKDKHIKRDTPKYTQAYASEHKQTHNFIRQRTYTIHTSAQKQLHKHTSTYKYTQAKDTRTKTQIQRNINSHTDTRTQT